MNGREKLQRALNHQEGPVPVDFGGTAVTGMHVTCVAALREHHGLEKRPVTVIEPYQMLGLIEDDLKTALGIDVVGIMPRSTMFGFPMGDWKGWRTPWGQEVLVPQGFQVEERADGVYIFPQGDASVPPSGHMPAGGYFFDTIIRQEPLDEDKLDPRENLEEFVPVSDQDLSHLRASTVKATTTGRGVIATFGGTAFGDIALVPAPFLKRPRGIRDISEWYMATATRKDYVHAIFSSQCDIALANLVKIHAVVGDQTDVAFICGTDFGTQTSRFCSVETFNELWLPYYRRVNEWIHGHTSWKTFKHSCGAVEPLLGRFIEAGFDVINPVQCSATGMEPEKIKERYGHQLVFWGGGVDTQRVLPFGTPEEVRAQVLERCRIFARGGGFVFDSIHNVQALTPVPNIVAMLDAVHEFNGE